MSGTTVIFSAPQGYGKTRQSEALRKEFGCDSVVEEWQRGDRMVPGALHLTDDKPAFCPAGTVQQRKPYCMHPEFIDVRLVARGWKT